MFYFFGAAFLSWFLYYKKARLPYYLNFLYINAKKIKNYSINKGFIKTREIIIPDTKTTLLEYRYKKDKFIIIGNNYDIMFPPYTEKFIKDVHSDNSLNNMIKTKDDIISSEIVYMNGETKDTLNISQMLCDPICRFYVGQTNKIEKEHLINYLKYKNLYKDGIKYNIMTCDGNEFDLLSQSE